MIRINENTVNDLFLLEYLLLTSQLKLIKTTSYRKTRVITQPELPKKILPQVTIPATEKHFIHQVIHRNKMWISLLMNSTKSVCSR
ncbi:hypothetical protein DM784_21895 [Vibrio furnissii]|nr:hypothetical protein DM784_21895 [Vibrio furnissii]